MTYGFRKMSRLVCMSIASAMLLAGLPAFGQVIPPMPPQPPVVAPAPPAPSGPEAKAFSVKMAELKTITEKLQALRAEYQSADEARQAAIPAEYDAIVESAIKMQDGMNELALKAYKAAPNADPEVLNFLLGNLAYLTQADDSEAAFELAKTLIDNKAGEQEPAVYAMAGINA
jgi:hypothetical protein